MHTCFVQHLKCELEDAVVFHLAPLSLLLPVHRLAASIGLPFAELPLDPQLGAALLAAATRFDCCLHSVALMTHLHPLPPMMTAAAHTQADQVHWPPLGRASP
jgi:hypothetical protein